MPSATAQAALIRDTYTRAGLDLTSKKDRCQYFEAHGTGTPAGDPQEAEALSTAFFSGKQRDPEDVLFVGSVKTVIGESRIPTVAFFLFLTRFRAHRRYCWISRTLESLHGSQTRSHSTKLALQPSQPKCGTIL